MKAAPRTSKGSASYYAQNHFPFFGWSALMYVQLSPAQGITSLPSSKIRTHDHGGKSEQVRGKQDNQ